MKIVDIVQKYETSWLCVLYAEDKESTQGEVAGLPSNVELASGSLVYTSEFDIGVLNDEGNWGWK